MPKILIADDSITVRKVAERLLTEAGMEVALAASGEEAMAWLASERPDFVISDVIMPDKSGYDVCKYVRSHADLSQTPVLLISGIVNEDVTRKAESCRADGVLKKPFQGASLQDRVLELLAKRGGKVSAEVPSMASLDGSVETAQEPVSDPVGFSTNTPAPGPKVFRITEEQLQTFRQSVNKIKELEASLAEERARSAQLAGQAESAQPWERRIAELETSLADQQQRRADLAEQVKRLEEVERRNQELESSLAGLQDKLSRGTEQPPVISGWSEDRILDWQSRLADQQGRLTELANQVMKYGDAETKIKALETSLANEQTRADEMAQRCTELERAAARATTRVEDLSRLLAQIARLASDPEEN
jgi:DNA-binding response OmpR family regulator